MTRLALIATAAMLVALTLVPSASAAPPECVTLSPYTPNPVQVDPNGCNELREYVCYQTIGRLIPYNCEQG